MRVQHVDDDGRKRTKDRAAAGETKRRKTGCGENFPADGSAVRDVTAPKIRDDNARRERELSIWR